LYPNPFNNFISIKTDNPKIINKIEVYDIMGRKIDTIKNNDKKSSLSLGYNLKPQMYYVQVYGDDFIKTFKVLKNSN
ncbi:MAG: T9SS type A sorting domain-containing protein, partial [Prolixibacteraceae bacterium]|nr:T9SS type A sorting domain-containing protein [Prolixibacteraceae bacterium]